MAPKGDRTQNAVQSIADPGPESYEKPLCSYTASGDAGDKYTASECQEKGNHLSCRQFLMEKQQRHQHYPDGRGIKQNRSRGKGHHGDGGEIAHREEEDAAKAEPQK